MLGRRWVRVEHSESWRDLDHEYPNISALELARTFGVTVFERTCDDGFMTRYAEMRVRVAES